MKISTILDDIDSGQMALPEFQRGYVWKRKQVRELFHSLYQRHPVGGLLVWATESKSTDHRGEGPLAAGTVNLILDGQQRLTSIYGVVRGRPPKFFDGDNKSFRGLRFHIDEERFEFYQQVKMKDDPRWIDVTGLMQRGADGLGALVAKFSSNPDTTGNVGDYVGRLSRLLGITDIELHIDRVTGTDKSVDVVVDIFNRVNSGGTTLSKGDLALAKICAKWPDARDQMKSKLREWEKNGYNFTLDWLLRSVNTILTGEAHFSFLRDKSALEFQSGLERAGMLLDKCLNMIADRLGLDHDRVLFGPLALPVMVRFLDRTSSHLDEKDRDKLLLWYVQAGMWGRFSAATETKIDRDLAVLESAEYDLDALLEELWLWNGGRRVEAQHFNKWGKGARFYPVLYMMSRMGSAQDFKSGLRLHKHKLGKHSQLEVHHIFPKAQLKGTYKTPEINSLANLCFLTKETNLYIGFRSPEDYFAEISDEHPTALSSQWIPEDRALWKLDRYLDFLEARRALLAEEANRQLEGLLHGEAYLLADASRPEPTELAVTITATAEPEELNGITPKSEEEVVEAVNRWVTSQGLPPGVVDYELSDAVTGAQLAVLDLAWPGGLQAELSEPVALLLNEPADVLSAAGAAGFRFFTNASDFRAYVATEIVDA